jgi:hypothetical protein
MGDIVFVHVNRCAVLERGLAPGDVVMVQGRGYNGSGKVMNEGRNPHGRVYHHVDGVMERETPRGRQQKTRFVVVVHGSSEWALGPIGQRRQPTPRSLGIVVQKWMVQDGAEVVWKAAVSEE